MKKIVVAALGIFMLFSALAPAVSGRALKDKAAEINPPPKVLPAVREWEGGVGKFTLQSGMTLALEKDGLLTGAQKAIILDYFRDVAGIETSFAVTDAKEGDVFFTALSDPELGDEGYVMEVGNVVTLSANAGKGLLYGVITLLQSFCADGHVPKGRARDYPAYPVRSGMIDVARAYIPLDYVEEITKYFAWFKLNEIHLHINDNGANGYHIFRLESDVPGLTATDGFYSKDDYRAYQKRMADYGVAVITEIDTPAHSRCFANVVPQYMLPDKAHIDVSNPDAVRFVLQLFDEYITGDDPVFVSKKVHFGTDEYPEGHNEAMRAYTDTLIKHMRSRGYTPRFWGPFGNGGFNGTTPVSGDAEVNFWADSLADYKTLLNMGYDIINSVSSRLYCVPGGNYGFPDYFDLSLLYRAWFVNYLGYGESTKVAPDHPQLKGASFCLWNDRHTEWGGFSMFDIFDRVRYQVALVAEKTWCGEQTRSIDADDFVSRFVLHSYRGGNTNPARYAKLPLRENDIGAVKAVGFPYLFSADIQVSAYQNADILSGGDGRLFINAAGKISFTRETYTFNYNYVVPKDTPVNIKLYADTKITVLIVDDAYYFEPVNLKNASLKDSATFVLPFEKAGDEGVTVTNISVKKPDFQLNDKKLNVNLALGKTVTVSGLEIDYGLNEPLAVDGNHDTRLSFARDKDMQWMVVDLGAERTVNKVVIEFHENVSAYEVYVSPDGDEYIKVYEVSGKPDGQHITDVIEFEPVECRFVKYVQLKRWYCAPYSTYYSGGIREFEVYGYNKAKYEGLADEAAALIRAAAESGANCKGVEAAKKALERYMAGETVYETHLNALYRELETEIEAFQHPPEESGTEESAPAPDESAPSAAVSEPSKTTPGGLPPYVWPLAAGALVLVAAAWYFGHRRKKA